MCVNRNRYTASVTSLAWRFLAPLLAMALLLGACADPGRPAPIVWVKDRPIADFTLTDQEGAPFRLSDHAGKVRLLNFGYTSCPDICPTTMIDWRDTKRLLGDEAEGVSFIMVTVDPDVDTPAVLKRFLGHFDPAFIGLSGTEDELQGVWDRFGVKVDEVKLSGSATEHSISHSTATYVVDGDGNLVMKFSFDAQPVDMARGIRELLEKSETGGGS